jgi:hypothetical protein
VKFPIILIMTRRLIHLGTCSKFQVNFEHEDINIYNIYIYIYIM